MRIACIGCTSRRHEENSARGDCPSGRVSTCVQDPWSRSTSHRRNAPCPISRNSRHFLACRAARFGKQSRSTCPTAFDLQDRFRASGAYPASTFACTNSTSGIPVRAVLFHAHVVRPLWAAILHELNCQRSYRPLAADVAYIFGFAVFLTSVT